MHKELKRLIDERREDIIEILQFYKNSVTMNSADLSNKDTDSLVDTLINYLTCYNEVCYNHKPLTLETFEKLNISIEDIDCIHFDLAKQMEFYPGATEYSMIYLKDGTDNDELDMYFNIIDNITDSKYIWNDEITARHLLACIDIDVVQKFIECGTKFSFGNNYEEDDKYTFEDMIDDNIDLPIGENYDT